MAPANIELCNSNQSAILHSFVSNGTRDLFVNDNKVGKVEKDIQSQPKVE